MHINSTIQLKKNGGLNMNYNFSIYFMDEIVSDVYMNTDEKKVDIKKYVTGPKQPLMSDRNDVEYVYNFLKSRCFSNGRPDLQNILKEHGMKSNNPYEWNRKTHGIMSKDFWWIKFPGENITWNDIKPRR